MKRKNWYSLQQGQKFESFTGMQAAKPVGMWREVGQRVLPQEVDVDPVEQQHYPEQEQQPLNQPIITPDVQGRLFPVEEEQQIPTDTYEPGVGVYL